MHPNEKLYEARQLLESATKQAASPWLRCEDTKETLNLLIGAIDNIRVATQELSNMVLHVYLKNLPEEDE